MSINKRVLKSDQNRGFPYFTIGIRTSSYTFVPLGDACDMITFCTRLRHTRYIYRNYRNLWVYWEYYNKVRCWYGKVLQSIEVSEIQKFEKPYSNIHYKIVSSSIQACRYKVRATCFTLLEVQGIG